MKQMYIKWKCKWWSIQNNTKSHKHQSSHVYFCISKVALTLNPLGALIPKLWKIKKQPPRVAHWWQTLQAPPLWSTSTTNAALEMSRHSLSVLTWPRSQLASDFMGGGSLHQPPPTGMSLLSAFSKGWVGWKSGHFDLANTPNLGKRV